jgi:hypothetical protein
MCVRGCANPLHLYEKDSHTQTTAWAEADRHAEGENKEGLEGGGKESEREREREREREGGGERGRETETDGEKEGRQFNTIRMSSEISHKAQHVRFGDLPNNISFLITAATPLWPSRPVNCNLTEIEL